MKDHLEDNGSIDDAIADDIEHRHPEDCEQYLLFHERGRDYLFFNERSREPPLAAGLIADSYWWRCEINEWRNINLTNLLIIRVFFTAIGACFHERVMWPDVI